MKNKAIFFDRDGTLIIDKHYMHKVEELEYFPTCFSTLKELQNRGYLLFMVTNQSGIGRGYFKVEQMHEVHDQMIKDFTEQEIKITDIAFCPHSPDDNCDCRKPSPKMIDELVAKYNIEASQSFMLGDKVIDAECGFNAKMKGFTIGKDDYQYNLNSLEDILKFAL